MSNFQPQNVPMLTPAKKLMNLFTTVGEMRAITLWQPYASLVAAGIKRIETRSWSTDYQGPLLIHAAKRPMTPTELSIIEEISNVLSNEEQTAVSSAKRSQLPSIADMPLGAIVAVTSIVEIKRTSKVFPFDEVEKYCGDWSDGRFAWALDPSFPLSNPLPAKGGQKLWYPDIFLISKVLDELKAKRAES